MPHSDIRTQEVLAGLRAVYGVNTNSGVLRRALAIALIAALHAKEWESEPQLPSIVGMPDDGNSSGGAPAQIQ